MRRLAIVGASGHGKVVAEIAELSGWRNIVFFDDAWPKITHNGPWPIVGNTKTLYENLENFDGVIIAIGDNQTRRQKHHELSQKTNSHIKLVHPRATISTYAKIGNGSVIMAGAVINPFASVGHACIINTGATIDHDCLIEDGVHISPGAHLAGAVSVGECTWIGIGASVKQCIAIGKNTVIGAGSVIVKNVPDSQTVIGVPGKSCDNTQK